AAFFDVDAASSTHCKFPAGCFINSDIRLIDNNAINKLVKKHRNDYILFSGCAPCQPYSKQNSNKKNDDPQLDT
ncbi:DNA (cytosine-5-)-methyltransferase, partial [Escherichia coli]